jgi:Tfp pilus assembly protein PilF
VLALDADNAHALENLVVICLQSARPGAAQQLLQRLVAAYPAQALYCDRLATLLEHRGSADEAIACYRRLLAAHPDFNNSRYNLARLLKRSGHEEDALREYGECLKRNIERPEEVHTNISVIHSGLHQHARAEQSLQAALALNPQFLPALFNLALLHEEQGDWTQARALYLQILEQQPQHPGALIQLANGERISDPVDPLIRTMKRALRRKQIEDIDRENLLYVLGKAHDDCGYYDLAIDYYRQANQYSVRRCSPYDATAQEQLTDQLISDCDKAWLASVEPASQAKHIFICGMFRSGSTLVEQILAAHPAITAGGEIDYFQRLVTPLPSSVLEATPQQVRALGRGYSDYLARTFPGAALVSNKRPDNFLYLGLIKALFPNARIIHIRRQPLDNCLSLFFQPLEAPMAYANELLHAGHYYRQYRRLMAHWRRLLGGAMLELDYEQLVAAPRNNIARTLEFLQLDWHENCLQFHQVGNRVRTASVHQVRQPLYQRSSGRWQNYASAMAPLRDYLQREGELD